MDIERRELLALTGLRFFAAAMIVLHHMQGKLGLPGLPNLGQGVAFFFVLSGFILTYVYPSLPTRDTIWKFFVARFARLWPAHFFALIVAIVLTHSFFEHGVPWGDVLRNILAIHAWIPTLKSMSINGPSWSISTEFGLYLLFPLLISGFEHNWRWKLFGTIVLTLSLVALAAALHLQWVADPPKLDASSLLYTWPPARLFEFVVGMCAASAWRRYPLRVGVLAGTAVELAVVALALANWYYFAVAFVPNAFMYWFAPSGSVAVPAALIYYVMASERGLISRALSWRPIVILGEASYSLYLLHGTIILAMVRVKPDNVSNALWLCIVVFVMLTASVATWLAVERPARNAIRRTMYSTRTRSTSVTQSLIATKPYISRD